MEPRSGCKYLSGCPIFNLFKSESLKNVWIKFYCLGYKNSECERLKLREKGEKVPDTLLPNGTYLK